MDIPLLKPMYFITIYIRPPQKEYLKAISIIEADAINNICLPYHTKRIINLRNTKSRFNCHFLKYDLLIIRLTYPKTNAQSKTLIQIKFIDHRINIINHKRMTPTTLLIGNKSILIKFSCETHKKFMWFENQI